MHEKYKSAMCITGLVTFIAAYHYFRIFNSWVDSYNFGPAGGDPSLSGKPFNDAYRYMDWLLTGKLHIPGGQGVFPDTTSSPPRVAFMS